MTTTRSPRQALFSRYSQRALQVLYPPHGDSPNVVESGTTTSIPSSRRPPLVLLTGGLRTETLLSSALSQKHAHLLGIGRSSITCPDLPRLLYHSIRGDTTFSMDSIPTPDLKGVGHPPSSWLSLLEHVCLAVVLWVCSFVPLELPPLAVGGVNMAWHIVAMRAIARGEEPDYSIGGLAAVFRMWLWRAPDPVVLG